MVIPEPVSRRHLLRLDPRIIPAKEIEPRRSRSDKIFLDNRFGRRDPA
jgi:hypothetical protein